MYFQTLIWFFIFVAPANAAPVVGLIAAFASTTLGSIVVNAAIGIALSIGASLLKGLFTRQSQSPDPGLQLQLRVGGANPLMFPLGDCATAGVRAYYGVWGNANGTPNEFAVDVIAVSALPVPGGMRGLWLNDQKVTIRTDLPKTEMGWPVEEYFRNGQYYVYVDFHDGTQTIFDSYLLNKFGNHPNYPWKPDMIGRGIAYLTLTCRYDRDGLWQNGYPTALVELSSVPLYDPRKDDTVGGSGSHRWGDPSTYEPSNNFAVHAYNVARGAFYYDGEWVYGGQNWPAHRLPVSSWVAAMNACDATISGRPQFHGGGMVECNVEIARTIEECLKSSSGLIAEIGGAYKIRVGAPGAPVMSFTDDNIIVTREQGFTPFPGLQDTYNIANVTYTEPEERWSTKESPERRDVAAIAADDNRELPFSVNLPWVLDNVTAQRIAQTALRNGRRFRRHSAYFPPIFWLIEPLDVVAWDSEYQQYSNKSFDVEQISGNSSLVQSIVIRENDPDDFSWDPVTDELPYEIVPVVPNVVPPQIVAGFQVFPATINDNSGQPQRPAIEVRYNGALTGIDSLRVQVRTQGEDEPFLDVFIPYPTDPVTTASAILNAVFVPNTVHEVRSRFVPISDRDTEWTAWLQVTTPNVSIDPGALTAELEAKIDRAAQQVADLFASSRQEFDELAAILNGQITLRTEKDGQIYQAVGARFEEAFARAELGLAAAADANSALASMFGTVLAQVGNNQAESLFRLVAAVTPEDSVASFAIEVRATINDEFAFSGFYIDAGNFPGGKLSRIRLVADSVWIETPGGARRNALLFSQNNESREAPIDINGEVRANLSDLELNHHTVLTEDVVVRAPVGLVAGARYSHAFVQESGGGKTVSFDTGEFALPHPTIDPLGGVTTYVDSYVRTVNPIRLTVRYDGYSVDVPILTFVDSNAQFDPGGAATDPVFDVSELDYETGDVLIALCGASRFKLVSTSPAGSEWPLHSRTPEGWSEISVARATHGPGTRVDTTSIVSAYWKISTGNETAFNPFEFGAPIGNPGAGGGGGQVTFLSYRLRGLPVHLGASPKSAVTIQSSGTTSQTIESFGSATPLIAVSYSYAVEPSFSVTPDVSLSDAGNWYVKIKQFGPEDTPSDIDTSVSNLTNGPSGLLSFYLYME